MLSFKITAERTTLTLSGSTPTFLDCYDTRIHALARLRRSRGVVDLGEVEIERTVTDYLPNRPPPPPPPGDTVV